MKIHLLTTESSTQIILTPENDYEKNIFKSLPDNPEATIGRGHIWNECMGGYYRQFNQTDDDYALYIKLDEKEK